MTGNVNTPFVGESNLTFDESTKILSVNGGGHISATKYVFASGGEISSDGSTMRFQF